MSALATDWKEIVPSERAANDEFASGVTIEDFDITDLMAFDPANDPTNMIGNCWVCAGGSGYGRAGVATAKAPL
jgi:hypothetical protein